MKVIIILKHRKVIQIITNYQKTYTPTSLYTDNKSTI